MDSLKYLPRNIKPTTSYAVKSLKLVKCRKCSRTFAEDRIEKHEAICSNVRNSSTSHDKKRVPPVSASTSNDSKSYKNNWRQKHEEFIKAIRAAKQVQQHLKNGGRLQDLPPPESSINPDYIQCPHCLRRFNQSAADRHIPKCATYEHNKPKNNNALDASRKSGIMRTQTPFMHSPSGMTNKTRSVLGTRINKNKN